MKNKQGEIASLVSMVLNVLLFAVKLWAGLVSNSVALIADAWHTLSDSISSIAVYLGLKMSSQPADENHPYGHGRAEIIAAVVVGVLLAVIGFNFFIESIVKLRSQEPVSYGLIAIVVTIISILIKEGMAQYSFFIGRKTKSGSLLADGWHHRSDAISSIIILVGILFGNQFWWMDGVLGIAVSLLLFYATYIILRDAISQLLGENLDEDQKIKIIKLGYEICDYDVQAHSFFAHHYGKHTELTFHIALPGSLSLDEAHDIATKYENIIMDELAISTTIHIEAK